MDKPSCQIETRIRYCETDRMGYLHHSRHATLMEMGRTELLRQKGVPYGELEDKGVLFAVREMNIKYLKPGFYDEIVTITTTLEQFRRASLVYSYKIDSSQGTIATATTSLACINRDGKPMAIPDFVRQAHGL